MARNLTTKQIKFLFASGILSRKGKSVIFNKTISESVNANIKMLVRSVKANVEDIGVKRARRQLAQDILIRRAGIKGRARKQQLSQAETQKKLKQSRKIERVLLQRYKPFIKK